MDSSEASNKNKTNRKTYSNDGQVVNHQSSICGLVNISTIRVRVLTGRDVDAGDRDSTLDHGLNDGGHVELRCRPDEATAEQRVDDEVVPAGDEM